MGYLRGKVDRVRYTNGTYSVFSFQVFESGDNRQVRSTTVSGYFFGINHFASGAVLEVSGEWEKHSKYGWQYKAYGWKPWSRNSSDAQFFLDHCVEVFDSWKLLRKVVARFKDNKVYASFGEPLLEVADSEEERSELVAVNLRWQALRGLSVLADLLQEQGVGSSLVGEVFSHFGVNSAEVISDNPYRLMEVHGFPFHKVESLARKKGIGLEDPKRTAGGILWVIREQTLQGHLFVRRGDIPSLMEELAFRENVPPFISQVEEVLTLLEKSEAVKIDPGVGVYSPETYRYEREAAAKLSQFLVPSELVIDLEIFLRDYEAVNNIVLSDMQREAIRRLIANRVLVVTGAPGTGKTTLIRSFVHLFRQLGISCMLMAPTGIAAKRLSTVTEAGAQTVHRALRYDGFQWGQNRFDPLEVQAAIVDEVSMVDQELFYRLLDALHPTTMLVLVGDDAQLPSVGPGNVLRELLACKAVPHVRLEYVFRQAETSDIVLAAHCIRRGASPLQLPKKKETEFDFRPVSDETLLAEFIVKMAAKLKARNANFQVLSPKYEGIVGVNNLNTLLRDELNPAKKGNGSWKLPGFEARIGDRLMVIKNNYKLNVYNGDIGKLVEISKDCLRVRIHGINNLPDMVVDIPKDQAAAMLKLAYAVTVHRCQGEEFETIILPLVKTQGRMLQRNLFYTAITRARKKVWLLGQSEAILRAVANDKVVQRNTVLRDLIVVV